MLIYNIYIYIYTHTHSIILNIYIYIHICYCCLYVILYMLFSLFISSYCPFNIYIYIYTHTLASQRGSWSQGRGGGERLLRCNYSNSNSNSNDNSNDNKDNERNNSNSSTVQRVYYFCKMCTTRALLRRCALLHLLSGNLVMETGCMQT